MYVRILPLSELELNFLKHKLLYVFHFNFSTNKSVNSNFLYKRLLLNNNIWQHEKTIQKYF